MSNPKSLEELLERLRRGEKPGSPEPVPTPSEPEPESKKGKKGATRAEAEAEMPIFTKDMLDAISKQVGESVSGAITGTIGAMQRSILSNEDIRRIIREEVPRHLTSGPSQPVEIKVAERPTVKLDEVLHKEFEHVLNMAVRDNVMLVGGAGSGKTTIARQVAKAMALPFHFTGAVGHEAKLLGYTNPMGEYVPTSFYKAWTNGGVFLLDEIDASDPQALLSINAALDNGICDFPCGMVEKHKDFHFIGAANTFGRGATMEYVGRNAQDEAGRSRWYYVNIDYDEGMEEKLAMMHSSPEISVPWCRYVRAVRGAVMKLKERQIISQRSTIKGAKALAAGVSRAKVEAAVLWTGIDDDRRKRVLAEARKIDNGAMYDGEIR